MAIFHKWRHVYYFWWSTWLYRAPWQKHQYWPPGWQALLLFFSPPGRAITYLTMIEDGGSSGGGGGGWQRWVSFALACVSRFISGSSNSIPVYLFDLKTQFEISQQACKCRFNHIQIFVKTLKPGDTYTRPWTMLSWFDICAAPIHYPD